MPSQKVASAMNIHGLDDVRYDEIVVSTLRASRNCGRGFRRLFS
jgi:hypothetical protein